MSETKPPSTPPKRWSEHHVEQLMGNLLRGGVLIAAAVVAVGGVLYLTRYGGEKVQKLDYATFHGELSELRGVGDIVRWTLALHSRGFIQFGLLLLIATPVARVAFAALAFQRSGDRLYVVVSLVVLALLLLSLSGLVAT